LILVITALSLGFLHGLGTDHLMAIAALSVDGKERTAGARRTRAIGVALRFAAGHALLLGCGAAAFMAIGWSIPVAFERGGEMLGGLLLVLMGAAGLWALVSGRLYGHTHQHGHDTHRHWHLHVGARERHSSAGGHSHLPMMIGAAFAVSSLRALATLAPFGAGAAAAPVPVLVLLIVVFAVGILVSMSLFGVALARVLSMHALERVGRATGALVGVSSVALGVTWIATNW
jgi:nickel/cobalt transporter (NicO) family protein